MHVDNSAVLATAWDWAALRRRCVREARRLVRDEQDAEEVVQEAMARAWRHRDRCRTPSQPLGWILQITRREAFRLLERRGSRRLREVREMAGTDVAGAESPHEGTAELLDIRRAVERLPKVDRALVEARYVLDLSQPAVAELLGMPEGTAKVRLHRIRLRLRDVLEQERTT
jgi:RNA polymerase sigma-70 factor (ECF subfamily)